MISINIYISSVLFYISLIERLNYYPFSLYYQVVIAPLLPLKFMAFSSLLLSRKHMSK